MKKYHINQFARQEKGASVMEFGLIAPVVVLMMLGTMDAGHSYYVRTVLDGAMQDVARDSSLQNSDITKIDEKIKKIVLVVAPGATVLPNRRYYKTFSAAATPSEEFTDTSYDLDGICNNNEPFVDVNRNAIWDRELGDSGQGGTQDVVILNTTVTFKRLFPLGALLGFPNEITISSNSILANQPYGTQTQYGPALTGICS
jgi:Flp pilus assembly pilin Flp